jgi:gamma-glutamyltranspeptidase / glutathione hydrolase
VLLQGLNILAGLDLRALRHNSPSYIHAVTEAMKLAFADREAYYGDPRHVKGPEDALLDPRYGEVRRVLLDGGGRGSRCLRQATRAPGSPC